MRVKVKFLRPIVKNGQLRKEGEELEMDATSAALLAEKGVVEIPGKKVVREKQEVEVVKVVDAKESPKGEKK